MSRLQRFQRKGLQGRKLVTQKLVPPKLPPQRPNHLQPQYQPAKAPDASDPRKSRFKDQLSNHLADTSVYFAISIMYDYSTSLSTSLSSTTWRATSRSLWPKRLMKNRSTRRHSWNTSRKEKRYATMSFSVKARRWSLMNENWGWDVGSRSRLYVLRVLEL